MQTTLIKVAILYAIYKYVPNQAVKAAALGVGGVIAAGYIPYLNNKNLKGEVL